MLRRLTKKVMKTVLDSTILKLYLVLVHISMNSLARIRENTTLYVG